MKTRSTDFSGTLPFQITFGGKKADKAKNAEKTDLEVPKDFSVTTAKQFEISLQKRPDKKTRVEVNGDKVTFSNPLTAKYHLWQPPEGKTPTTPNRLWTKRYIGTDAGFYKAGYRWGVSLGGTPEEFKKSSLYLPGGGINLPDGKYVVGLRADAEGKIEVVIGKEERGIDQRVIADFKDGKKPEANGRKEILNVANHSMLISRGQPFESGKGNEDKFSAYFAGEVNVEDFQFNAINDQSGQFFGPNGLTSPTKTGQEPTDNEKFMKQPDYEKQKTNALEFAKATLESITGQKDRQQDIHMVKVEFVRDAAPLDELKLPRETKIKASQTEKLVTYLKEKPVQDLVDMFETEPEDQLRLLEALAKNGKQHNVILNLTQQMVIKGTMKPEQAAKLALELFVMPQAVEMFLPDSPLFIPGVTDNSKRKLIAGYNALGLESEQPLPEFVKSLKNEHPIILQFLMGRRMAGGYVKLALSNLKDAAKAIFSTLSLFKFADKPATILAPKATLAGDNPKFIWRLESSLKPLEKQLKADSDENSPTEIVILNNPFDGKTEVATAALQDNVKRLRELSTEGATVYRTENTNIDRAVDYLTNLFAYAYEPQTAQTQLFQKEIQSLLNGYGVDAQELRSFAKDKFQGRWSNDQIVAAYAQEHKAFRSLLNDLAWFRDLPTLNRG